MSFHGKSFVIIGATGGIGSVLARELSAAGASLLLAGRTPEQLAILGSELGALMSVVDATQAAQVDECVQEAVAQFGKIDGIVNCAGSLLLKPAHLTSEADWAGALAANLTTAFHTVRSGARAMLKTGGSIVLMSSAAARLGLANHEAIAAAKAGVIGLTLSAAATYARQGIRVNCVAPGLVKTPLTARITGNETALKGSVGMHALGRAGEPGDVAQAIRWLLDPSNSWTTGQVIGVDGGLGTVRS